jgi:sulfoxide reductase catalytic subunit YedY
MEREATMLIRIPRGWEIREREATPESAFLHRRRFLGNLGAMGALLARPGIGTADPAPTGPAGLTSRRNSDYDVEMGRLTGAFAATHYNNFYEFSEQKDVYKHVEKFETRPWTVEVAGLVAKPRTWGIEELLNQPLEERVYRFRCVEAWYMNVPWIGFPLRRLLEAAEPLAKARYVRFVSFLAPEQAPGQKRMKWYKWPYYEGLTLPEAMNELALATVGVYGKELPKQNGAPFRVVVPWKYGYKGPKSVVRIELTRKRPRTFWNDLHPDEYGFESNVNPKVPHPRWSQAQEKSIDGAGTRPTLPYNGYGRWVAALYS